MSLATLPATPSVAASTRPRRDVAVDVARAVCLVVVVMLHAMMVGVSETGGVPVFENAMDEWAWFPAATWIVQVMPLFFVLGGFSSFTDWTGRRAAGESAGGYVLQRMRRLLVPAIAAVAATALFVAVLALCGLPASVVTAAGFHSSQPLWFLGVYILCTALVPALAAAHRAAPVRTVGILALIAFGIDVLRAATGIEAIGFANLLFVWLLVQQLGFFLADGSVSRVGAKRLVGVVLGALALLLVVVGTGFWSGDLFHALNPPTGALVLLGIAQLGAFELLRPRLRVLHDLAPIRAAVEAIGSRSMTIYMWHMPVLIALAGIALLLPGESPVPLSDGWWASRPVWLLAVGVAVSLVALAAGRIERAKTARVVGTPRPRMVVLIVAVAAGSVLVILASGGALAGWVVGLGGLALAVRATHRRANDAASGNPSGMRSVPVAQPRAQASAQPRA